MHSYPPNAYSHPTSTHSERLLYACVNQINPSIRPWQHRNRPKHPTHPIVAGFERQMVRAPSWLLAFHQECTFTTRPLLAIVYRSSEHTKDVGTRPMYTMSARYLLSYTASCWPVDSHSTYTYSHISTFSHLRKETACYRYLRERSPCIHTQCTHFPLIQNQ